MTPPEASTGQIESVHVPQLDEGRASLHHVGIVVASEDEAARLIGLFGLREDFRGVVEQYQALCIFASGRAGSPIEFVIPSGGVLKNFNGGGGGIHHVALEVDDLAESAAELSAQGEQLLEPSPVKGAGEFLINFLAPTSKRRFIVELVQPLGE